MARAKKDPALEVACPRCNELVGHPCVSSGGTTLRNPHEARAQVGKAVRRLNSGGLRGQIPGQYVVKDLLPVERNELDPDVSDDALLQSRVSGRPVVDDYVIETILNEDDSVLHIIDCNGQRWVLVPKVADRLQRHRRRLSEARAADAEAVKVLAKYGRPVDELEPTP